MNREASPHGGATKILAPRRPIRASGVPNPRDPCPDGRDAVLHHRRAWAFSAVCFSRSASTDRARRHTKAMYSLARPASLRATRACGFNCVCWGQSKGSEFKEVSTNQTWRVPNKSWQASTLCAQVWALDTISITEGQNQARSSTNRLLARLRALGQASRESACSPEFALETWGIVEIVEIRAMSAHARCLTSSRTSYARKGASAAPPISPRLAEAIEIRDFEVARSAPRGIG